MVKPLWLRCLAHVRRSHRREDVGPPLRGEGVEGERGSITVRSRERALAPCPPSFQRCSAEAHSTQFFSLPRISRKTPHIRTKSDGHPFRGRFLCDVNQRKRCDACHVGRCLDKNLDNESGRLLVERIFSSMRLRSSSATREQSNTRAGHDKNARLPPNIEKNNSFCNCFARLCSESCAVLMYDKNHASLVPILGADKLCSFAHGRMSFLNLGGAALCLSSCRRHQRPVVRRRSLRRRLSLARSFSLARLCGLRKAVMRHCT